ncbi:DUF5988 family protein [Microlunatus ginsengisoli]
MTSSAAVREDAVEAYLAGGPTDFPVALRRTHVPRSAHKVKVEHRGGREQFECMDRAVRDERGALVYTWFQRTPIAE